MKTAFRLRSTLCFAIGVLIVVFSASVAHAQWPLQRGYAVMTLAARTTSGDASTVAPTISNYVIRVIDIRQHAQEPVDVDWTSAPVYSHPSWRLDTMGHVFGIAIDSVGAIYVTATAIYGGPTYYTNYAPGPGGHGAVYKINALTGDWTTFASLPNVAGPNAPAPGLGNITIDHVRSQLFVTNLDNGKIYRLSSTGAVLSTYDPFLADDGLAGLAPLGERVWGVAYHCNRIYFSRWRGDLSDPTLPRNEVWSIAIHPTTGDFVGTPVLELTLPTTVPNNPVSDVEFSSAGEMLLAQRTWYGVGKMLPAPGPNWGLHAGLLRYKNLAGSWQPAPQTYSVGCIVNLPYSTPFSCAGGAAWGYGNYDTTLSIPILCDSAVVSTGDRLHNGSCGYPDILNGLQIFPSIGGTTGNSVLFDIDHIHNNGVDVAFQGDVDVFSCSPVLCPPPTIQCCTGFTTTLSSSLTQTSMSTATLTTSATIPTASYSRVRVTILNATVRRTCPPTTLQPAVINISSMSVTGLPTTTTSGATAWSSGVTGTTSSANITLALNIQPSAPFAPWWCRDTVKFCVRYEFTNAACVTCDTTVCYTLVRKQVLSQGGGSTRAIVPLPQGTAQMVSKPLAIPATDPTIKNLAPNPASSVITFELHSTEVSTSAIHVADASGMPKNVNIRRSSADTNVEHITIDCSTLAQGSYVVTCTAAHGATSARFDVRR